MRVINKTALASLLAVAVGVQAQESSVTRSFYGMAYSPDGALLPQCGADQANVTRDMGKLAQLTPRIRL
jgi:hypothetical protein